MSTTVVAMNSAAPVHFSRTEFGTTMMTNGMQRPKVMGIDGVVYTGGLSKPTAALTIASSGVGSLTGTYTAYYRYKDNNRGHYSDFSPISSEITIASDAQIDYSVIPAADPDTRATHVEVWRNTDGQSSVYFLDATITIGTTTATSTKTDDDLEASTALRLVNLDGTHGSNRHGLPPSWKKVAIPHKDRMFYLVDMVYKAHCQVNNSSDAVTGINTQFTSDMVDRLFYVRGVNTKYTIDGFTNATTISLNSNYAGTTDLFAQATICPDPKERVRVYFSEDNLPESVPQDQNYLVLQEHSKDWSPVTAGAQLGDFLLLFKERHMFRLYFSESPLFDGELPMIASRGCVNQNTWCLADDVLFVMDYKGIYAFDSQSTQAVSLPIQDLFHFDSAIHLNWDAADQFHAVHNPQREEVQFFVCLKSQFFPQAALTYNYRLNRWHIDYYRFPIGSSCVAHLGRALIPFYGISHDRVAVGTQSHDLLSTPKAYSTATGSTYLTLSDTAADFTGTPVDTPVSIIDGPGVGQTRLVSKVTATKLWINVPWTVLPGTTSKYQLGAVPWKVKFGKFRFTSLPQNHVHVIDVFFTPTANTSWIHLRRYYDYNLSPELHPFKYDVGDIGHADTDSADFEIDTKKARSRGTNSGHAHYEIGKTVEPRTAVSRVLSIELRGFQGPDRADIQRIELTGFQR